MHEALIEQLKRENELLRKENELLRARVDLLVRRMFGRKSEQLNPNQLELLLGESPAVAAVDQDPPPEPPKPSRRSRKNRKPRCPEDLPVETETIDPVPVTGNPSAWRQIGEEVSE